MDSGLSTPTGILASASDNGTTVLPDGSVTVMTGLGSWFTGVVFLGGVGLLLLLDTEGAEGDESGVIGAA